MRTLFLAAKIIAMNEKAEKITILHMKKALPGIYIFDEEARKLLYTYLQFKENNKVMFTDEDIQMAKKHHKIQFGDDLIKLKEVMAAKGWKLNSKISKLYRNKENSINKLRYIAHSLEEALKSEIFAQDEAIEAVCDKVVESMYHRNSRMPRGIFFFLGPPATGKTTLAKILGKHLEGYDGFKVLDMTQFENESSGFALFGLPKGYRDAREGTLTSYVKKFPKSILVFDEIEKAAPTVHSNFLEVLSSGRAKDAYTEEEIDFSETYMIFTSNIGSELYSNSAFLQMMRNDPDNAQSTILEAISREKKLYNGRMINVLSPEILSRLSQGEIVLFNKLSLWALLQIAQNSLVTVLDRFNSTFNIETTFKNMERIALLLLLSMAPVIDVRRLVSKIPLKVFDVLTDYLRRTDNTIDRIIISVEPKSKKILNEILSKESNIQNGMLHELFRNNETYDYKIRFKKTKNRLSLVFHSFHRKKLPKAKDFIGDSGIVFNIPSICFEDIAGHHEAKMRLQEIINLLKSPEKLAAYRVELPKGMLLYGLPGTGKTMLAKAFAKEANLPFLETTGTELLDIDFMKKIFKRAREYAPSIVFIDEIDALGHRDGSKKDILINQLLTEINGFPDNPKERIFIIAATNFMEKIDPAILRSGRIDLHVPIERLDRDARAYFIDKILKKPTKGDFDKEKLILYTAGMSGADLEKAERESTLYVLRNGLEALTEEILIEQINTVKYGERIVHHSVDDIIASTAIHEAAHAVVSKVLMPETKIEQVTVVPRKTSLGFVAYDRSDRYDNLTKKDFENKICVAFAGRIAQVEKYGEKGLDAGAAEDLKVAARHAWYAVAVLGMDEELGFLNIKGLPDDLYKDVIERTVMKWLNRSKKVTEKLVKQYWQAIESVSDLLIREEVIGDKEIVEILKS